jgi:alpha-galactosidase/6-phospho-beta-glucosidase family protein
MYLYQKKAMKQLLIFISIVLLYPFTARADSPLTSTSFSEAYTDVAIVQKAADGNGIITEEYMDFLSCKKEEIDVKMAVINALSWDFDGKSNYQSYLEYLEKKYKTKKVEKEEKFYKKLTADETLALAYLLSLDDYFEVGEAVVIANKAVEKSKSSKTSYTFHIIRGLIKAQSLFSDSWCLVWKSTDEVRKNTTLNKDMREDAISIIFDYMDLYKEDC